MADSSLKAKYFEKKRQWYFSKQYIIIYLKGVVYFVFMEEIYGGKEMKEHNSVPQSNIGQGGVAREFDTLEAEKQL